MSNEAGARRQVQVCLVSEQATPNLTPLLDPALRPDEVCLVVSPDMAAAGDRLAEVAREQGLRVSRLDIADAWDYAGTSDALMGWLGEHAGDEVRLNVTGGTKVMAMAAQEVFGADGRAVFYVRLDRDEVVWLDRSHPRPPQRLDNRVRLGSFLKAHGWRVLERPAVDSQKAELRELTATLVGRVRAWEGAIGALNFYAAEAQRTLTARLNQEHATAGRHADFDALLDLLCRAELCEVAGGVLRFRDEAARFFCNGGWLERHATEVANTLRKDCGVQDLSPGLMVQSAGKRLEALGGGNEIDLAILARNRLHIVECKTKSFDAFKGGASDALYKLDSLGRFGGIATRKLLLSYRRLNDADRQRASDLGIKVVEGGQLGELRTHMAEWLGGRKGD